MPATAFSFGDGLFGINSAETGFLIETITHAYQNKNKTVLDRTGNTIGYTAYDETVKVSLKGRVPKTGAFSGTLASSLTLGNSLSAYLKGGATTGLNIIESITIDLNNEDYRSISLECTNFPNITA
jgi:hypothetical protein